MLQVPWRRYRMRGLWYLGSHPSRRVVVTGNLTDQRQSCLGQASAIARRDDEIAAMDHNTWVELLCQNQVLTHTMTLATIRTRVWRSGGDVVLKYRRRKLD